MSLTDPPLHPELAQLRSQYERLIDNVSSGAVAPDEAEAQLAHIGCFDSTHARWAIDVDGNFTRQVHPDAEVMPTSPAAFVPAQLPPPRSEPAWTPPAVEEPRSIAAPRRKRTSRSRTEGPRPVVAWLHRYRTLLTVLAIGAALIVTVVVTRSGPPPEPAPAPSGTTVVSRTPTIDSPVPDGDRVHEAVSALTSGQRDLAATFIVADGDPAAFASTAATFAGLEAVGLELTAGPPTAVAGDKASQIWTVRDAASQADVASYNAQWVRSEGKWLLERWPTPS